MANVGVFEGQEFAETRSSRGSKCEDQSDISRLRWKLLSMSIITLWKLEADHLVAENFASS